VFLSGGPGGLYRIDPDGSNQTLIINTLFSQATWSPDGKYIAATLSEKVNDKWISNIYIMKADGSNPVKITDTQDLYHLPSWSK
jgi:Tol biopolymer transport system component